MGFTNQGGVVADFGILVHDHIVQINISADFTALHDNAVLDMGTNIHLGIAKNNAVINGAIDDTAAADNRVGDLGRVIIEGGVVIFYFGMNGIFTQKKLLHNFVFQQIHTGFHIIFEAVHPFDITGMLGPENPEGVNVIFNHIH